MAFHLSPKAFGGFTIAVIASGLMVSCQSQERSQPPSASVLPSSFLTPESGNTLSVSELPEISSETSSTGTVPDAYEPVRVEPTSASYSLSSNLGQDIATLEPEPEKSSKKPKRDKEKEKGTKHDDHDDRDDDDD